LVSLAVSARLVFFNFRLRSVEARHALLRDAAQAHELAIKSQIEAEYLRTVAPGTLFEEELSEMVFPGVKSMADSLELLIKEYRGLPMDKAISLHPAYQDRVLIMQSSLSSHANRLAFIKSVIAGHGLPTA
jgi:hypothetical protein